jgi:phosphinothricin acetyltransferase
MDRAMGEIKFIKTTEKDLQACKDIYTYYIKNSTATFHIGDISDTDMHDILFCDLEGYESYVIFDEDEALGYVLLAPFKKREAYRRTAEVTIYLKPEMSNRGIGNKAIEFIEDVAKNNNFRSLLSVVCGENIASIKLFEKNGYYKCGLMKNVGEKFGRVLDIVTLQKEI